ncbi:hypothetical protein Tco_0467219, partial [Tanacetum coccineum]
VSVEVLRYDIKKEKNENKGIVPTEMELVLEYTQQGSSHEVSVSTERVEERKRIVRTKGVKKEALHTLRQKPGQYICCQNHKLIADNEDDIMDPVMQCTTLLSHSGFSQQKLVSFVTEMHKLSIDISLRDC